MEEKFPSMLAMEYLKLRQRVGELEAIEAECKEVNESLGRFIFLLNELPLPLCICGINGAVIYQNKSFEDLACIPLDPAEQLDPFDSGGLHELKKSLEIALKGQRSQTGLSFDGKGLFDFACIPLKNDLGRITGVAVIGNKTAAKQAEKEHADNPKIFEQQPGGQGAVFKDSLLTKVLDGANDAIIIADISDGKLIYVNSMASVLTGKPVNKLIGMDHVGLHPAEDADYYRRLFEEYSLKNSSITEEEIFVQHVYGNRIPVEISTNIIEFEGRRALLGVFRDISGRVNTDKDLKRLKMLFDNNVCPIISADINGNIEYVNAAFERAVGFKAEDVVGMQMKNIISNMSRTENDKMRMALYEGRPWRGVVENRKKDGSACTFNILITPIRSKSGQITSFLSVHHHHAG